MIHIPRLFVAASLLLVVPMMSHAAEKPAPGVGDAAPDFTLKDDAGKDWKAAEHFADKTVVLYFYPADTTGGCTKQACGYRDDSAALKKAGVEAVGVSGDSVRNHQLFKKLHNLDFTLLADEQGDVAELFGVPHTDGEKSVKALIDGQEETLIRTATIQRWTVIVKDGKIVYKNAVKDAAGDSKAVLETVAKLK